MNDMSPNSLSVADAASRVRALLPEIAARADETEAAARVPQDLLDKLEQAGAFRIGLPLSLGGEGMSVGQVAAVIRDVATADASAAWHLMVAVGTQVITARLPLDTLKAYYAQSPDTWAKAAAAPKGIATPVEGGYRLSGRWPLASGARPFEWISLGFFIKDETGLRRLPNGAPDMRICLIPRGDVQVIETWDAVGLRGTRSDDLEVRDVFVPEASQAPFGAPAQLPESEFIVGMPFATGPHHSAVVIGILHAAIADLATVSLTRKPAFNPTVLMKDDPVFRSRFGELAARVEAVEALADRSIAILERCAQERRGVTPIEAGQLLGGESLVHHEGTSIMDAIMMLSGSGGVYMSNPQQRRWRDLRCVAQHVAATISNYAQFADALIGRAAEQAAKSEGGK